MPQPKPQEQAALNQLVSELNVLVTYVEQQLSTRHKTEESITRRVGTALPVRVFQRLFAWLGRRITPGTSVLITSLWLFFSLGIIVRYSILVMILHTAAIGSATQGGEAWLHLMVLSTWFLFILVFLIHSIWTVVQMVRESPNEKWRLRQLAAIVLLGTCLYHLTNYLEAPLVVTLPLNPPWFLLLLNGCTLIWLFLLLIYTGLQVAMIATFVRQAVIETMHALIWYISSHHVRPLDRMQAFALAPLPFRKAESPFPLLGLEPADLEALHGLADHRRQSLYNRLIPTTLLLAALGVVFGDTFQTALLGWSRGLLAGGTTLLDIGILSFGISLVLAAVSFIALSGLDLLNQGLVMDHVVEVVSLAQNAKRVAAVTEAQTLAASEAALNRLGARGLGRWWRTLRKPGQKQ